MSKVARYTLTLYIDRPMDAEDAAYLYIDQKAKSELEREVLSTLRRFDGDCDCEVMTAEIVEEG